MKYSKKDLMNEGWASMETLLDKEMPTNKKDYNYALIALFVLFAFGIGIWTGTQIHSNNDTAESSPQILETQVGQEVSMLDINTPSISANNVVETSNTVSQQELIDNKLNSSIEAPSNSIRYNVKPGGESNQNRTTTSEFDSSNNNQSKNKLVHNAILGDQEIVVDEVVNRTFGSLGMINIIPFKKMVSEAIATSYLPRSSSKIRNTTNWVLGLGLNTGVNVDRNTKVLSLNSDWMYKIGKQNAIGIQFLYAAEDEFGFFPKSAEPVQSPRPGTEEESEGRNPSKDLKQNSRQYRFASGLVIQQEIGYRFYSNFAFGIDMLQNSYSEDIQLKSLNNVKDIQYHFGGYTSIALGYRISKLVDLEISATKSMLIEGAGIYKPGNSDHLVGGVKISF